MAFLLSFESLWALAFLFTFLLAFPASKLTEELPPIKFFLCHARTSLSNDLYKFFLKAYKIWPSSYSNNRTSQYQFSVLVTFLGAKTNYFTITNLKEEGVFWATPLWWGSINGLSLASNNKHRKANASIDLTSSFVSLISLRFQPIQWCYLHTGQVIFPGNTLRDPSKGALHSWPVHLLIQPSSHNQQSHR